MQYQILKDKNINIELAIVLVMYICRDRSDKKYKIKIFKKKNDETFKMTYFKFWLTANKKL